MSRKQEIYRELLGRCLPDLRNCLSHYYQPRLLRWLSRKDQKHLRQHYEIAQLVHNLYVSILDEEFVDHDIWFLNHQARGFIEYGDTKSDYYSVVAYYIQELFKTVPDELRGKLE